MKRRYLVIAELLLLATLTVWVVLALVAKQTRPEGGMEIKVQLRDAQDTATLLREPDGRFAYRVTSMEGHTTTLTPDQFAARMFEEKASRSWLEAVLNVTSPIGFLWVTVGLIGQVLFTGRMIVQWVVSEKHKASVVPPMFWWMSLIGATMLLVYFMWRKDPIGLLGQSVGWFVYVRNLWFIYRPKAAPAEQLAG